MWICRINIMYIHLSASFFFIFSELVFLWLSASQNVVRQRVKIDRFLGVEGGQFKHGGSLVGYLFVLRKFVFEHQNINK